MVLPESEYTLNKLVYSHIFMLVFISNNSDNLYISFILKESLKTLYIPNIEWV